VSGVAEWALRTGKIDRPALRRMLGRAARLSGDDSTLTVPGWRLDTCIGHGRTARVYAATRESDNQTAALKILSARQAVYWSARLQFQRGAEAQRDCTHPAIARYISYSTTNDGVDWLAMHIVTGPSLQQRFDASDAPDASETLAILRSVADALATMHANGWVHRDIKPSNILLPADGRATLIDLGLAARNGSPAAPVGTSAFRAPEVARTTEPEQSVDPRADVYSLGRVWQAIREARCATDAAPPLLGEMLQPTPDTRPADAAIVREALATTS